MKVQEKIPHTSGQVPKHLVTNLEFKVQLHKRKTKFLRARVDTCADVKLIPLSVYQKLFKDTDCTQIESSNLQLGTYTNKRVKIIGSCHLYTIYPDTRCLEKVRFYIAGNKGSVLISCTTSLQLGLIKPKEKIDHLPPEGKRKVIYSRADKIKKKKQDESCLEVHMLVQEDKMESSAVKIQERCSQRKQSNNNGTHSNKQENKNKKSQVAAKIVYMWPVKNMENKAMQLSKPLVVPKEYRRLCKDNACQ